MMRDSELRAMEMNHNFQMQQMKMQMFMAAQFA